MHEWKCKHLGHSSECVWPGDSDSDVDDEAPELCQLAEEALEQYAAGGYTQCGLARPNKRYERLHRFDMLFDWRQTTGFRKWRGRHARNCNCLDDVCPL